MVLTTTSPSVFISYRRADSGGWAGRLHAELVRVFGEERVFLDERMRPGIDFEEHIENVLDACSVVYVVIGPDWARMLGPDGTLRLSEPDDVLCHEIARALSRPDVEVVPLLVGGAKLPEAAALPPAIQKLTRIHAAELSSSRWDYDMERLITHLKSKLGDVTHMLSPTPDTGDSGSRSHSPGGGATAGNAGHASGGGAVSRTEHETGGGSQDGDGRAARDPAALTSAERGTAAAAMVVAAALGVLISSLFNSGLADRRQPGAPEIDRLIYFAAERAVLWAIVSALVLAAIAVTMRRDRAGAIGAAIVGLGAGAVGGALSGAAYMALKDQEILSSPQLLRGVAVAIAAVVIAPAIARLLSGARSIYMLAGLAGGLLAGILAHELLHDPSQTRGVGMILFESVVVIAAFAAVATTASPGFAGRGRGATRS